MRYQAFVSASVIALLAGGAAAQELNLYSSRHYQTDEALYADFTAQTGITINRIEDGADKLIARLESEGVNSPADVLLTVDAGRIYRAEQKGLFIPVITETLTTSVPPTFRHPDGLWYGFSRRARLIYFNPDVVASPPQTYEDLADPQYRGLVCIRSGSNIYQLSLMSALIDRYGEQGALEWAEGVVANFARQPQSNDTGQIRSVASGECGVSLGNSYYYARLLRSDAQEDKDVVANVTPIWPNQKTTGTHYNISGAGVLKNAPNKDEAVQFMEYLVSESAQRYFADGNNEYPIIEGIAPNAALQQIGEERADTINVSVYGKNQTLAQQIYDRAGWK